MMAKVKQPFGETRFVPWLGRDVADGEVVEVSDGDLPGYLEGGWEPADKSTKTAQHKLWEAGTVTVGAPPKKKPVEENTAAGQADNSGDAEAETES